MTPHICVFLFLLTCIGGVYSRFIYQCPQCGSVPQGMVESETIDLSNNDKVLDLSHNKFKTQEYYRGIKIFGASLVIYEDEDSIQTPLFGHWYSESDINQYVPDIIATILEEDALTSVLSDLFITHDDIHLMHTSELDIYPDSTTNIVYLAYVFEFVYFDADEPGEVFTVFAVVNAVSSHEILKLVNTARSLNACGPGGNDKIGTYRYCDDKPGTAIKDNTRWTPKLKYETNDFLIYDKENTGWRPTEGSWTKFKCAREDPDDVTLDTCYTDQYEHEVNGGYGTGIDAYHNSKQTWDMYQDWMGEKPIIEPKPFPIYVHVLEDWANAAFIGNAIVFGDGGQNYHPLVALDVVAHEIAHGYTNRYSDLIYDNESGAMNEAYSDIVAVAAWTYARGDGVTKFKFWKIGYSEARSENGAFRYMYNPPLDGYSVGHYCDYYDGMNVHGSSGIYNKAAFNLQRKSGIRKWSMEEIFRVFSTANKGYWSRDTTMREGVCGLISALYDVYYTRSDYDLMEDALVDAFDKVGLNCDSPTVCP